MKPQIKLSTKFFRYVPGIDKNFYQIYKNESDTVFGSVLLSNGKFLVQITTFATVQEVNDVVSFVNRITRKFLKNK
jgi:hypothetical protein